MLPQGHLFQPILHEERRNRTDTENYYLEKMLVVDSQLCNSPPV